MQIEAIRAKILTAFGHLKATYALNGAWRYPGSRSGEEGYLGPWGWSEGDYQYQLARLLEVEFPGCIHVEMPIRPCMVRNLGLPQGARGIEHIDIVVSDLSALSPEPEEAGRQFRAHRHEAFIEVKRYLKADPRWKSTNWRDFKKAVPADAERLGRHLVAERCVLAMMLIVDDWGCHVPRMRDLGLGTDEDPVEYLILSPPVCPNCLSSDAVPIIWGMPGQHLDEQARLGRVILGGCLVYGDERDPDWECHSCRNRWADSKSRPAYLPVS